MVVWSAAVWWWGWAASAGVEEAVAACGSRVGMTVAYRLPCESYVLGWVERLAVLAVSVSGGMWAWEAYHEQAGVGARR